MDTARSKAIPKLGKDASFWGMTATQFLGAFNDNLYKQMVLLICLDYVAQRNLQNDPYQSIAGALLAIPFVMFSGTAGFLSDKFSKRHVVILCKVAEIFVMAAGMAAFWIGEIGSQSLIILLLVVLFFMGTQSAFFGPSKYGILPEMLRNTDLPPANGIIQMTTFLAIIFGMALAGILKDFLGNELWIVSAVCIGIAIAGTLTAILLRPTPIANPEIQFSPECVLVEKNAWRYLWSDKPLFTVVIVYMLFWFAGAVVLLVVNAVAKNQLGFREGTTSLSAACMGIGIAIGCITCGKISGKRVRFDLVRVGAWGTFIALIVVSLISLLGPRIELVRAAHVAEIQQQNVPADPAGLEKKIAAAKESAVISSEVQLAMLFGGSLVVAGFFAGIFAVPLQVFVQARPPEQIKGRVIGATGLITWIGILFSSAYYFVSTAILGGLRWPLSWSFIFVGVILGGVGWFFRQSNDVTPPPDLSKEL